MSRLGPMSARAQDLLRHYREAETLASADVSRLLASVERAAAGGGPGSAQGPQGHGSGAAHGASHAAGGKLLAGALPKVLIGMLVAAGPAVWGARAMRPAADAVATVKATSVASTPRAAPAPAAVAATAATAASSGGAVVPVEQLPVAGPASRGGLTQGLAAGGTPATRGGQGVERSDRGLTAVGPPTAAVITAGAGAQSTTTAAEAPGRIQGSAPSPAPAFGAVPMVGAAPSVGAAPVVGAAPAIGAGSSIGPAPAAAGSTPAGAGAATGVDEEVRLLGRAYEQLRAGRASLALATLAAQERRFPDGKMAEARQVARVIALCAAGRRDESRAEKARFLAAHPGSPFTGRVRDACPE